MISHFNSPFNRGGGVDLLLHFQYAVDDGLRLLKYNFILESQGTNVIVERQILIASHVMLWIGAIEVIVSIKLDGKSQGRAVEVEDMRPNAVLPAELEPANLLAF